MVHKLERIIAILGGEEEELRGGTTVVIGVGEKRIQTKTA